MLPAFRQYVLPIDVFLRARCPPIFFGYPGVALKRLSSTFHWTYLFPPLLHFVVESLPPFLKILKGRSPIPLFFRSGFPPSRSSPAICRFFAMTDACILFLQPHGRHPSFFRVRNPRSFRSSDSFSRQRRFFCHAFVPLSLAIPLISLSRPASSASFP